MNREKAFKTGIVDRSVTLNLAHFASCCPLRNSVKLIDNNANIMMLAKRKFPAL